MTAANSGGKCPWYSELTAFPDGTGVNGPGHDAVTGAALTAKSTHSPQTLTVMQDSLGDDVMQNIRTDFAKAVPSIIPAGIPADIPAMSDDECLVRLAQAVREHDSEHLDELARLIGRLAVTIE